MSFFGIILTSVITVLHVYVFTRLAPLPWCRSGLGRKLLLGSGLLLWLIFVLGRTLRRHEGTLLAELFEFAGMQWMGSLFLLAAALLAVDLISGFGLFLPQVLVFRLRSIALACGAVLVLTAHVQGLRPPVVEQYEVTVNRLPADLDGIKIAMISDLHLGEMLINADWLKARVQQVQALQPDCIVLVGDIFEKTPDPAALVPVLRQLSAPLGVFAVWGNHDLMRSGRQEAGAAILADAGIRLLRNQGTLLADHLLLAGIDDLTLAHRRGETEEGEGYLSRALADRPAGAATILLSHTPWQVEQAAASGVSLMLSGHTHNGQIWPFTYLARIPYPFVSGQYVVDGMNLIVCRGTGTWGPRMRLWQRSEIALIRLRSAASS
ncbi:Metallophosphoesterase [Candidatus Electronema halotolerans]